MRKIFQYILMAVAVVATASCSNELDEALQLADNGALQFVVSDFQPLERAHRLVLSEYQTLARRLGRKVIRLLLP